MIGISVPHKIPKGGNFFQDQGVPGGRGSGGLRPPEVGENICKDNENQMKICHV